MDNNEKSYLLPTLSREQKNSSKRGTIGQHQLHILSKKSWHVWNRENIEKVEKDEKLHEETLKREKEKTLSMENENRLRSLRFKISEQKNKLSQKQNKPNSKPMDNAKIYDENGNINFFFNDLKNKTKENSKTKTKTDFNSKKHADKKFYLGQTTLKNSPWYNSTRTKLLEESKKPADMQNSFYPKWLRGKTRVLRKREEKKLREDPLAEMKTFLDVKKRRDRFLVEESRTGKEIIRKLEICQEKKRIERRKNYQLDRIKKIEAIKRGKYRVKSDVKELIINTREKSESKSGKKSLLMADLRKERLEREKVEREKAENLIANVRGNFNRSNKEKTIRYHGGFMSFKAK